MDNGKGRKKIIEIRRERERERERERDDGEVIQRKKEN